MPLSAVALEQVVTLQEAGVNEETAWIEAAAQAILLAAIETTVAAVKDDDLEAPDYRLQLLERAAVFRRRRAEYEGRALETDGSSKPPMEAAYQ